MAKKFISRALHGFGITVSVCLLVQLVIAQLTGNSVTPSFGSHFRNEAAAALAQLGLTGIVGATFASAAEIFEIERWGFLRQGIVHFLVTAAVWMPIAYLCWMPDSRVGIWIAIGGWTLTYAVNWTVQYLIYRHRIAALNRSIQAYRRRDHHAGN